MSLKTKSSGLYYLWSDGIIKFYCHYVDDILLVKKPEKLSHVYDLINQFDNNLRFTVDLFENDTPHFLNLEISPNRTSFSMKIQTLNFTLISTVLCFGHIVSLGLEVWCLVHPHLFTKQIISRNQHDLKTSISE